VALARAVARRPAALLLDEPLAALDPRTRAGAGRELAALLRDAGVPALLVTHDFTEAALLGDRVGIVDRGRVIQAGTAGELAAAPASAFVADFTGATVLTGEAAPGADGLTRVELDGGGSVASVEPGHGRVAVSVYPWEVALDAPEAVPTGSAQNHVEAEVVSVTAVGNRIRVGMATPQPLVAEITGPSARELALEPGARVVATWKAAATRVLPL
jgi:molybdate transport system ATP-binding protein